MLLQPVRTCWSPTCYRLFEHVTAGHVVVFSSMLQPDMCTFSSMLQPDMLPPFPACCSRTWAAQAPIDHRHFQAVWQSRDVYPGSWFLPILDPGSRISDPRSRISDPRSRIQRQQQKREVKKISCHSFLCSHIFHKIVNYFSFEVLKKKIWANFQRIIELFTKKL